MRRVRVPPAAASRAPALPVGGAPYAFLESIVTRRQFDRTIAVARREGAHQLFFPARLLTEAHRSVLMADGFSEEADRGGVSLWSDAR